jgi:hypothetical protein
MPSEHGAEIVATLQVPTQDDQRAAALLFIYLFNLLAFDQ